MMPQAFHLSCCQQRDLSFSLPACCSARQKRKQPGPTWSCPTPEPAHCRVDASHPSRFVLPSPLLHPQRSACLPQPGVHRGFLHGDLLLKRTPLQCRYPDERSGIVFSACLYERTPLIRGFCTGILMTAVPETF